MFTRMVTGLAVALLLAGVGAPARAADDAHASPAPPAHAEGETSADQHGGSDINPIPMRWEDVKGDLAIWTAAVFLVLLAVLSRFAWKPLAEGLDKRERQVANQIAQAEAANQKAQDVLADYDRKLAAAADQVRAILDQGRRDAEGVGQELVDKAKEEAKAEYQRALKQIEAATNAALKELADQGATLAIELAGKIIRAKINPSDHARLIEEAVSGFVRGKSDVNSVSRN